MTALDPKRTSQAQRAAPIGFHHYDFILFWHDISLLVYAFELAPTGDNYPPH
jgi:hypothetical protein